MFPVKTPKRTNVSFDQRQWPRRTHHGPIRTSCLDCFANCYNCNGVFHYLFQKRFVLLAMLQADPSPSTHPVCACGFHKWFIAMIVANRYFVRWHSSQSTISLCVCVYLAHRHCSMPNGSLRLIEWHYPIRHLVVYSVVYSVWVMNHKLWFIDRLIYDSLGLQLLKSTAAVDRLPRKVTLNNSKFSKFRST